MKSTEIKNEASIFELFKKISEEGSDILIWTEGQRNLKSLISAKINKIDLARKVLIIVIDNAYLKISERDIKLRDKIYVKTKDKGLFFQQRAIKFEKNRLLIPFPKTLKIHEHRTKERQTLGIKSGVKAIIKNTTQSNKNIEKNVFSLKLYDYNKTGVSFLIPLGQSILFNVNDKVSIVRFIDIQDEFSTSGVIKSLVKIESKENNIFKSYIKMGVLLNIPLTPKLIHQFQCYAEGNQPKKKSA